MLELFVISMCIGEFACTDALKQYKNQEPIKYKYYKSRGEEFVYSYIDKDIMIAATSIGIALAKNELKIKIAKRYVLSIDKNESIVYYKIEF